MSSLPHIADAEGNFLAVNIAPDFCEVDGKVVPFDIVRDLPSEKSGYASTVLARGDKKVLKVGSVAAGVQGNAGSGVVSGTSLGGGNVLVVQGASTVLVEGSGVARHDDLCLMNGP